MIVAATRTDRNVTEERIDVEQAKANRGGGNLRFGSQPNKGAGRGCDGVEESNASTPTGNGDSILGEQREREGSKSAEETIGKVKPLSKEPFTKPFFLYVITDNEQKKRYLKKMDKTKEPAFG